MQRRLAVILMADMVDYSRLMESDQVKAIGLINELRNQWLEPEATGRAGEILKRMGDGWIIAFGAIGEAIETAQAVQASLAKHSQIKLRIAVHLGEIAEDGTDLYGASINIAARLQTEAPPGGVMISEDLHRQLDDKLAEEFAEAGSFELKNIKRPIKGFQWRPVTKDGALNEDIPVIAIPPLATAPAEPELADAAADLHEQLSSRLSRRTGVRVLSLDEERHAQATYILKGRLRLDRTVVRLTLSLILGEDGRVVWSETYNDKADKLLVLVDRVVEQADADLRLTINKLDAERFSHLPDDALSASELRARAAYCLYLWTEDSYNHAANLLERSLQLAPENPMAFAMWAYVQTALLKARFAKGEQSLLNQIIARADAAAQLDQRSDFVAKTRAEIILKILGDLDGAKRACERARRINPSYSLLKIVEIEISLAEGAWDRASELCGAYRDEHSIDDDLPYVLYMWSVALFLAERFDEAVNSLEQAIELRPSCRRYWHLLSETYRQMGDRASEEKAKATMDRLTDDVDVSAPELVLPEGQATLMDVLAPREVRQ